MRIASTSSNSWSASSGTAGSSRVYDDQHKGLFALANALQTAIDDASGDDDAVANAVYGLTDYCVEHFVDEEALMRRVGYPELVPHRSLHEKLSGETMRIAAKYFNEESVMPDTLAPLITSWLTDHIRRQDMTLVAFIRAQQPRGE